MKALLTISLLFCASLCFGQSPYKKVADQNKKVDSLHREVVLTDIQKQVIEVYKKRSDEFQKETTEYRKFLLYIIDANHIPVERILNDSVKFLDNKILLPLKPKQK